MTRLPAPTKPVRIEVMPCVFRVFGNQRDSH
jgi:hypothetical protein